MCGAAYTPLSPCLDQQLEKGAKKRKGKQSIGASSESWVERSIEILAAIDPPRSAKPSPPKGIRKLPVPTSHTHAQRTSSSAIARRERKPPKTPPPPQVQQDSLQAVTRGSAPGVIDMLGHRKSPRGSDVGLPPARYSAEVVPDVVGGGDLQMPQQATHDSGPSNGNSNAANTANARTPWQQWQQSNPERKLPRVILKVREPGT